MDNKPTVIYLHGFASSANNSKAEWLRQKNEEEEFVDFYPFDFNPTPADFSSLTVTGMINRLRQFILSENIGQPLLVGSSLGGLVALHYARMFGGVKTLLLLAPALRFYSEHYDQKSAKRDEFIPVFHYAFNQEIPLLKTYFLDGQNYEEIIPPPVKTVILHGKQDEVVPFEDSKAYAALYPEQVKLTGLVTNHRMSDQVDVIWDWIKKLSL